MKKGVERVKEVEGKREGQKQQIEKQTDRQTEREKGLPEAIG